MRARWPSALLLVAALCACGAGRGVRVELQPGPELDAQALAVLPVHFRWDEPDYRAWELSQLLVLEAIACQRYAVFGPDEVRLLTQSESNPFVGSDVVLVVAEGGLSPQAALIVSPSVERRAQAERRQVFDARGRPVGARDAEQVTLIARLEVFHSATRERILRLESPVPLEPLAVRDRDDPTPELTASLRALMRAALDALRHRAPGRTRERSVGFEHAFNPKAALDFAQEGRAPLRAELARLDALEQDLVLESRLRFFHPDASPALMRLLKRAEPGLVLTAVSDPETGLEPGDVVLSVEGAPARPQTLHRALRAAAPGERLELTVRQRGAVIRLPVPVR